MVRRRERGKGRRGKGEFGGGQQGAVSGRSLAVGVEEVGLKRERKREVAGGGLGGWGWCGVGGGECGWGKRRGGIRGGRSEEGEG